MPPRSCGQCANCLFERVEGIVAGAALATALAEVEPSLKAHRALPGLVHKPKGPVCSDVMIHSVRSRTGYTAGTYTSSLHCQWCLDKLIACTHDTRRSCGSGRGDAVDHDVDEVARASRLGWGVAEERPDLDSLCGMAGDAPHLTAARTRAEGCLGVQLGRGGKRGGGAWCLEVEVELRV